MNQEFQAQVIAACKEHRAKNLSYDNLNDKNSLYVGEYFVKFGYQRDLEPERATQEFFFNHAQAQQPQTSTPRPPCIAKIVHHFVEKYTMYLVMERIKLQESPPDLAARIHEAMKWLSEVPPPPNSTLGPVGGGPIRHKFFQEFVAPFTFPGYQDARSVCE
ncbi:hypothetical protein H0H81_001317 [Sphagnurus paluster]|uniref:Uncharacterized protein n=1 Tax=Sphagnurus paluster TaxID=117069 RepID=A0A9P7K377_9AGAR|nr:hypothetical protein H0H81_001317 [Sphagnurus paluster]